MSDDPPLDPKHTLPLHPGQAAAPAVPAARVPVNARATQMSPAPIAATLESLQDRDRNRDGESTEKTERTAGLDEISGMIQEATERDDSALQAALRDAGVAQLAARRAGGPQTLASPAAVGPIGIPQRDAEGGPSPPPPPAVIDVGAPAHAFLPSAPPAAFQGGRDALGSSPGLGSGPPPGMGPGYGAPGMQSVYPAHAPQIHAGGSQAPPRKAMSMAVIMLIVVGAVVGVIVIAAGIGGFFFYTSRRSPDRNRPSLPNLPGPTESNTPPTEEAPRNDPRSPMGGSKARLTGLVARSLDLNKARGAVAAAGPRFDACFAATELEPPNHETSAYDLDVAPSGEVTRADPATQTGRCALLDACMVQSLRAMRMPRSPAGSTVKLTFTAKIP